MFTSGCYNVDVYHADIPTAESVVQTLLSLTTRPNRLDTIRLIKAVLGCSMHNAKSIWDAYDAVYTMLPLMINKDMSECRLFADKPDDETLWAVHIIRRK